MEMFHTDSEPWTIECPECGICKQTDKQMYDHRRNVHGLGAAAQNDNFAMRLTDEQIRAFEEIWTGDEPTGKVQPYMKHIRCHFCGECQVKDHTWAWHAGAACVLKRLPRLAAAFPRRDLHARDACHCTAIPELQSSLQCSPLLQEVLGYDEDELRTHPDVAQFYRMLSNADKDTKSVYLLFRAKPDTRMSEDELARNVFYVGQANDLSDRLQWYAKLLREPRQQMNKRQERFMYELETAMRNDESVIMLKVRVDVGGDILKRFHPDVLESSLMLLLGMDRLSNVELSLVKSWNNLSDDVKSVLVHARLAAAAAFKATARVVDVDAGEIWDLTAWVDVSKELLKHQASTTGPSVSHATTVSSNYPSAADVQSTSVSNATTSDVCSDATFDSSSGQASSSSDVSSSLLAKQASSGQPSAIAAKRCVISDSSEGSERGTSVSSGNASAIFVPPVKKLRLSTEAACSTSTLLMPDSIVGGLVSKHVKSFGTLLQTLDCSAEDVIRNWSPLVSKYFVASDGLTASHLPTFSPPVQPSDSTESVELWPLPHGSMGTFAQLQRRNG